MCVRPLLCMPAQLLMRKRSSIEGQPCSWRSIIEVRPCACAQLDSPDPSTATNATVLLRAVLPGDMWMGVGLSMDGVDTVSSLTARAH